MSLITRCPVCGTMFKVVADQLKVAQGWARCGHCTEIFDASAHLQTGEAASEELAADPVVTASNMAADFDPVRWLKDIQDYQQSREQAAKFDAPPVHALPDDLPSRRPALTHTAAADDFGVRSLDAAESEAVAFDTTDVAAMESEAPSDVSFVRDARRKAFWGKPLARWSLSVISVLLLLALTLQWVMQQKDTLAVREPRLVPLLQMLCIPLRCDIRPPRDIDALVIDSSTFTRIGPEAYRLNFALKNTGSMSLEIPFLEVTLTDTRDQAVVRRVLAPAQFAANAATLAAHAELLGVVNMKVSGAAGVDAVPAQPPAPLRVAGYRILAFYP